MTTPRDIDDLATIAEWLARSAHLMDRVTSAITEAIDDLRAEQRRQREDIAALSNRIEAVSRVVASRTDHLA